MAQSARWLETAVCRTPVQGCGTSHWQLPANSYACRRNEMGAEGRPGCHQRLPQSQIPESPLPCLSGEGYEGEPPTNSQGRILRDSCPPHSVSEGRVLSESCPPQSWEGMREEWEHCSGYPKSRPYQPDHRDVPTGWETVSHPVWFPGSRVKSRTVVVSSPTGTAATPGPTCVTICSSRSYEGVGVPPSSSPAVGASEVPETGGVMRAPSPGKGRPDHQVCAGSNCPMSKLSKALSISPARVVWALLQTVTKARCGSKSLLSTKTLHLRIVCPMSQVSKLKQCHVTC